VKWNDYWSNYDIMQTVYNIKPSMSIAVFIAVLYLLCAALLGLYLSPWLAVSGCLVLGVAMVRIAAYHFGDISVGRIVLQPQGEWILYDRKGRYWTAEIESSSVITPWIMVLNFRTGAQSHKYLVLLWDNLESQSRRSLRIQLKSSHVLCLKRLKHRHIR